MSHINRSQSSNLSTKTSYSCNMEPNSARHRPSVVFQGQILQGLHQSSLHVARFGGLHRGVDQALAPSHGVEKELRRL